MANVKGNLPGFTNPTNEAWKSADAYVYQSGDNASYASASSDESILVAGPARVTGLEGPAWVYGLQAVGVCTNFQWSQRKQIQPMKTIGSQRNFMITGPTGPFTASLGTWMIKGHSMVKNLYFNAISRGIDLGMFDRAPFAKGNEGQWNDITSRVMDIPFGFGVIVRDITKTIISARYFEMCYIQNDGFVIQPGQTIMKNINIIGDRSIPWNVGRVENTDLRAEMDKANSFENPEANI